MKKIMSMKPFFYLSVAFTLLITATVCHGESPEEEARRRGTPVLYSADVPDNYVSDENVLIKWAILGYHPSYRSTVAFFYGKGSSFGNNFKDSGRLSPVMSEESSWTFNDVHATICHYEYRFTPPQVFDPTNIVIRFYRINEDDEAEGNSGMSLLIPGNIAERYYDTSGRRITATIWPSAEDMVRPDTDPDLDSSHYNTSDNPFHPNYNGQCTWFAWGRVNEVLGVKVSTTGNAKTWWVNTTLPKGHTPLPDSIAIWNNDRQGSACNAGHVAYVEYTDDEKIHYTEANVDTYGNTTTGCSGCGGGYDGSVKESSMEAFMDRGNGIGTLSGFIYPALQLSDWWIKSSTTFDGDQFDGQFKVSNLGRSPIVIQDSRVAVYRASGQFFGSARVEEKPSVVLLPGQRHHHPFSQLLMSGEGKYFARAEILVNGEWIVVGNAQSFQVF